MPAGTVVARVLGPESLRVTSVAGGKLKPDAGIGAVPGGAPTMQSFEAVTALQKASWAKVRRVARVLCYGTGSYRATSTSAYFHAFSCATFDSQGTRGAQVLGDRRRKDRARGQDAREVSLVLALRLLLAAVFAVAAVAKLAAPGTLRTTLLRFGLPRRLAPAAAPPSRGRAGGGGGIALRPSRLARRAGRARAARPLQRRDRRSVGARTPAGVQLLRRGAREADRSGDAGAEPGAPRLRGGRGRGGAEAAPVPARSAGSAIRCSSPSARWPCSPPVRRLWSPHCSAGTAGCSPGSTSSRQSSGRGRRSASPRPTSSCRTSTASSSRWPTSGRRASLSCCSSAIRAVAPARRSSPRSAAGSASTTGRLRSRSSRAETPRRTGRGRRSTA